MQKILDQFFRVKESCREVVPQMQYTVVERNDALTKPYGLGFQSVYELQASFGIEFMCNKAEYEGALRIAKQRVVRMLYQDIWDMAAEIASTSTDSSARKLAHEMMQLMKGNS